MLQYCLNVTAIWLMSLVLFDIFLKRQPYHGYNRAYLLLTFALGFFLPLWEWQERTNIDNNEAAVPTPADAVAVLKHNVMEAEPVKAFVNFDNWLMLVYAAGMVVSLALLMQEVLVVARLYRKGRKSKDGVWTIVETGKKHSPFSALNTIFISNKQDYETENLHTIMTHEQKHVVAFHFIDLLIMQLSKTLLWFHPLVYLYQQRLMMVHEYQADSAISIAPSAYGSFLLEQSMLAKAPTISHSFHRSPIKNRIMMLNRKTSRPAARLLLPLPLLLICMLCFTKNSFAGGKPKLEGNKLTYKGNVFEMMIYPNDTVVVEDPLTGKQEMRVMTRDPRPLKINGAPIYDEADVNTPVGLKDGTVTEMRNELAEKFKYLFKDLKNGQYTAQLYTMIVDNKGKIVYQSEPYINIPPNLSKDEETKRLVNVAAGKIVAILEDETIFDPAMKDGKAVASYSPAGFSIQYRFDVKDHVVTYVQ